MRPAALLVVIVAIAPGCQLFFSIDPPKDVIPHVPFEEEGVGDADLIVPTQDRYTLDTETLVVSGNNFQSHVPFVIKQDNVDSDLTILRVRNLVIEVGGTLAITGETRPFVLMAETVTINGLLDASAAHARQGPGGGRPEMSDPGQGAPGDSTGTFADNNSGGGGGGFAPGAGGGGSVSCVARDVEGGGGGDEVGDAELLVLQGGGAGGSGGSACDMIGVVARGGGGGGAIQLSAAVTITIGVDGGILAGGGGGEGGLGTASCANDGGGAGGGAGGAIYLDAPEIASDGFMQAHGGGGAAGGQTGAGAPDGQDGFNAAADPPNNSQGGFGIGKGKSGGDGGTPTAAAGESGMCLGGEGSVFNAGGGGGAPGRIVLRGEVRQIGSVSPNPKVIDRPPI